MKKKYLVALVVVLAAFLIGYGVSKRNDNKGNDSQTATKSISVSQKTLDLSGQQLTTLPPSALNRSDVTTLDISNNQFVSLPASITTLENLETLKVDNNRLVSFSPDLSKLTHLTQIYANNNRLTNVPKELNSMKNLKVLDISGNNIPSDQIAQLRVNLPNTNIKF